MTATYFTRFQRLKRRLFVRAFLRDTEGSMTIEMMLWLPLILTVIAGTFSLHDAFRYKTLNTKAAFTISDAISRETTAIDGPYLDGMVDLMAFLTRSEGPYSLRVTLVRFDAGEDTTDGTTPAATGEYLVEWSQTRGEFGELQTMDLADMTDQLPVLLDNEHVIVVETETDYTPPFAVPALNEARMFYTFGFTRPRFAPKITWAEG
ncbi:pilus assembly protein [Sagittula sp. NFXS13]|uniref:TadE/TadG family type IV pilus assembly protein n=1 Tax=Sagittula sp. NFXS13 TaxID=2819095 RepID=UPI0032DE778C